LNRLLRCVAIVLLLAGGALLFVTNLYCAFQHGEAMGDYGSFFASGRAANRGANPFGVYPGTYSFELQGRRVFAPNLNPPILVYPLSWLARLPSRDVLTAWSVVSLLLAGACMVALYARGPKGAAGVRLAVWGCSLAALWQSVHFGQIYPLLLALTVVTWIMLLDGDSWMAGLPLGLLVAIKPNFVLWPLLLLFWPSRRAGASAVAVAALLSAIPLLISGAIVYREWLQSVRGHTNLIPSLGNSSLYAVAVRLQVPWIGLVASALIVAVTLAAVTYLRPSVQLVSTLGILVALLIGPISWLGYTLLLLPALWTRWSPEVCVAASLLVVPFWLLGVLPGQFVTWMYALPLIVLFAACLRSVAAQREMKLPVASDI
jgi:hypothetical protein